MNEKECLARAYLRMLQGYEAAAAIYKDRYVYARLSARKDSHAEKAYVQTERKADLIRKELFQSLSTIANENSRQVLWLLYIERKQVDEVAHYLCLSPDAVLRLRKKGLRSIEIPDEMIEVLLRRREELNKKPCAND